MLTFLHFFLSFFFFLGLVVVETKGELTLSRFEYPGISISPEVVWAAGVKLSFYW